jgi:signal transduction histidine kinase
MRARVLTVRYVGALLVVAGLLIAGQTVIHQLLARQEGDARVINLAGRQRMLGQRLCTLLLARDLDAALAAPGELARTADDWERNQAALRAGRPETGLLAGNSLVVRGLFAQIDADHRAMLAAARAALVASGDEAAADHARAACTHQEVFLAGMDRIVAEYEREARQRVVGLRRLEFVLLGLALLVLALEGLFVFRPAVRGLRLHLAERDLTQRQLLQVADREQVRLAQDLHDGIGQQLIGASFLLRTLRRQLDDGPAAARLDEVGKLITDAVDHTRDVVRSLHSPALEAAGLAAALGELAVHIERVFGVECRLHDRAGFEPPAASRAHLHRIAREAVVNAAKHAHATLIEIELACDAGELTLVVRDDGVGIDPRPRTGLGLQLMAHRARLLGGSLEVAAGPSRGTVVTCRVALRELATAEAGP